MTVGVELGRIDWARANLRIGTDNYGRCHVWGDGTTYFAENANGDPIGSLTVRLSDEGFPTVERIDAKTYLMVGQDGAEWNVSRAGCNCQ